MSYNYTSQQSRQRSHVCRVCQKPTLHVCHAKAMEEPVFLVAVGIVATLFTCGLGVPILVVCIYSAANMKKNFHCQVCGAASYLKY